MVWLQYLVVALVYVLSMRLGLSQKGKHVLIQVRWNLDNPEERAAYVELVKYAEQAKQDSGRDPMRLVFRELVMAYATGKPAPRFGDAETRMERMVQREFDALNDKLDTLELQALVSDNNRAAVQEGIDDDFYNIVRADHQNKGGRR